MFTARISRLALLTVVSSVVAAATAAPGASAAAQRYASPGGQGSACSAAEPCSIVDAVTGAKVDDEVILAPGDYPLSATLQANHITMHGVAGQPRPRLLFSGPGQLGLRVWYGTLRYAEVDQLAATGTPAVWASHSTVDQLIAHAPSRTAEIHNTIIRNSIVVAFGADGRALETSTAAAENTSTYRNVTAIASGSGGRAITATAAYGSAGKATIHAINVIARGGAGGYGVRAFTDSSGAQATITANHSNYAGDSTEGTNAMITSEGGNQSDAPVFADAAGGDYRVAAGSATIDAGLDETLNGLLDVDGGPRSFGTTDIGANELAGPAPTPSPDPVPSADPPADPPAQTFAGVRLVSTRLTVAGRFITVRLSCAAGTAGGCSGATKLTARRRRTVTLGRTSFSIAAGQRARVRVRVSRAGRRLFAHSRRVSGRAANAAHSGSGQSKTTVAAVTIRRRTALPR